VEPRGPNVLLRVQDFGIGITPENQRYIFDGLFPTQEMEIYSSRRPCDFSAGGKGLDLLQMKVYAQRYGLELSVESDDASIYLFLWDPKSPEEKGIDLPIE
jgi:signal transduction histidine kinase